MALVTLLGGVLLALGSFLPWITATAPFVGQFSKSGMDAGGDGFVTLFGGFLAGALAVFMLQTSETTRAQGVVLVLTALACGGVVALDYNDVQGRVADAGELVAVQTGSGLYACGIGAALVAAASLMVLVPPRGD